METVICELRSRDFASCITETCKRVVPARNGKGIRVAGWIAHGPPVYRSLPPESVLSARLSR
jgi:hypothetical protein